MTPTPETLKTLFERSIRNKWNLSELEVALDLHADAWLASEQARQRAEERLAKANEAFNRGMLFEHAIWCNRLGKTHCNCGLSDLRAALAPDETK